MADDVDIANERAEAIRQAAIINRQRAPEPKATGHCLSCERRVAHGRRWCGVVCRDEWEKENA